MYGSTAQVGHVSGNVLVGVGAGGPPEQDRVPFWVTAPPRLVNQRSPIDEARSIIDSGRAVVTLLTMFGPPGIGTSAVALKLLHTVFTKDPGRFPGGFYEVSPARDGIGESLSGQLRRFGYQPAEVPAAVEGRAVLLREEVHRRGACALLVDRPDSLAQIGPFIPQTPGSLLLVAAPRPFDPPLDDFAEGSGDPVFAHVEFDEVPIGPLDREHALKLLSRKAGAAWESPEETRMAERLAESASGFPHRLARIAGRIRRSRSSEAGGLRTAYREILPTDALERTAQARPVHELLSGLPGDAKELCARLAWHPDTDFGPEIAARLAGGDRPATDRLLGVLVREELLTIGDGSGQQPWCGDEPRYRFGKAGDAAAIREGAVGGHEAVNEVLDHYLGLALAAHAVLLPGRWLHDAPAQPSPRPGLEFEDAEAAVRRLECERFALKGTVAFAIRHGRPDTAFRLCEALWAFWFRRDRFDDIVDTHSTLLAAADSGGSSGSSGIEPAKLSRVRVQRSIALRRDGKFDDALDDAAQALRLAREAHPGHPLALLTAIEAVGDVHLERGAYAQARACFSEACDIAVALDPPDPRAVLNAAHKQGRARLGEGALDEAADLLAWAWSRVAEPARRDPHNEARLHTSQGELELRRGRLDEALRQWEAALSAHRAAGGNRRRMAEVHVKRADAMQRAEPDAAREELERAARLFEDAGARREAAVLTRRLANWPQR